MWLGELTKYAPLITAAIAILALIAAIASILVQRNLARKRAAIDFFLKTELDEKMIVARQNSASAMKDLRKMPVITDDFYETDNYHRIRTYLNIHELLSIGVRHKLLDERICFRSWASLLSDAFVGAEGLIKHLRTQRKIENAYREMESLHIRWTKIRERRGKWNR